jgi:pentafunctional AROM polypeptide
MGSVRVKAHVVTHDEKESGLRGLINFGHSIGHAIEAILAPSLLHGEAIAIGMVLEAQVARYLGHLEQAHVSRLDRCIKAFELPTSLDEKRVSSLHSANKLSVDLLMEKLSVDKKNVGTTKKMVLLSRIGATVELKASSVPDNAILHVLSPEKLIRPVTSLISKKEYSLDVPGSKSISNRALILAALGRGTCRIKGLLHSDDTQHMINSLQTLQACHFEWEDNGETLVVHGGGGNLVHSGMTLFLGNAGTAARFLTTVCCIPSADNNPKASFTILTGNERMQERPIGPLVSALQANGYDIAYLKRNGSLPLKISTTKYLKQATIKLSASVSSQYVSSILMSAPYITQDSLTLDLSGDQVISQPYIDMTIAMMRQFGVVVEERQKSVYHVKRMCYTNPAVYSVEGDASSATYPLAYAAITGRTVKVNNIGSLSLQGDAQFAKLVLEPMGCKVSQDECSTTVTGPQMGQLIPLGRIDIETMTDAFLTASVLAAVAGKGGRTDIVGIANQRVKECDRIGAMVTELRKFGVEACELPDGLSILGVSLASLRTPSVGVFCYDDHRVAMSFSILGTVTPKYTLIADKKCVEKTWPTWWETLEMRLDVKIEPHKRQNTLELESPISASKISVVLIGMRAVGKTSLGKRAACAMGKRFVDLDEEVEKRVGKPISEYVVTHGWEAFRDIESVVFLEQLALHPYDTIIAAGGGLVERPGCREVLKQLEKRVIHVTRDMQEVFSVLEKDNTRPSFSQDIQEVWHRRKPLYEDCSSYEFHIVEDGHNWTYVVNEFCLFLSTTAWGSKDLPSLDLPKHDTVVDNTFFLSLTYPDIKEAESDVRLLTEGVDAVELRVDLLRCPQDLDFVRSQVSALRRLTTLPIIFTVRTKRHGGHFPNDSEQLLSQLLLSGVRWGCRYIDVELDLPKNLINNIKRAAVNCLIIASHHNVGQLSGQHSLKEIITIANGIGDIIKYVDVPSTFTDNLDILQLGYYRSQYTKELKTKPVIAINMGIQGQMTRVLNSYLTPVTHNLLPSKAAPGQLSVGQIMELRVKLGLLQEREFYLFGTPIAHSMSPLLHNTGFKHWNLPYSYQLFETDNPDRAKEILWTSNFGGASVTIPLKEKIIPYLDELSPDAKRIGAVNTICVMSSATPTTAKKRLKGYNTDWLGIKRGIEARLSKRGSSSTLESALVVGAGGTSRAAIYALQALNIPCIYIYNRTQSKAEYLCQEFGITLATNLEDLPPLDVVVGTIPASAQCFLSKGQAIFTHKEQQSPGIFVEMAYKPRKTALASLAEKSGWLIVSGIEVLIQQGLEAFYLWTGKTPPYEAMSSEVLVSYTMQELQL